LGEDRSFPLDIASRAARPNSSDVPLRLENVMDKQAVSRRDTIRRLNDQFRRFGLGNGRVTLTLGIHDQGLGFTGDVLDAVRDFVAFDRDNDPYGEHDFGALTVEGQRIFFKIDYYDLSLQAHSPDAADPAVTHRVMTIMLASEY
jgi:Protein of unknown function (DUF3768)